MDQIIEVGASAVAHDQGYSGWMQLDDGRIFVVNYTDDTAPLVKGNLGVTWIRRGLPFALRLAPGCQIAQRVAGATLRRQELHQKVNRRD